MLIRGVFSFPASMDARDDFREEFSRAVAVVHSRSTGGVDMVRRDPCCPAREL